ncbi:MAG: diguanylate cyclase [Aliidiomarina sp.]|uniref:sensor domain-containing diguanylate cyclase n=1 Tax=Aliidiomarina sp. TaxID=1872439 RepID=UPI0025B91FD7|nr:sensor domain-containing diguanylate cyclase [Aliidiomarina sp.]MCH8501729.1 diguanylate cyclase [Aliidiomarina sp.]
MPNDTSLEKLARLEDILHSAGAATWEWNVQTGELILNEMWAQLLGYTLAELEPISIATFQRYSHQDDFAKTTALFERVFANIDNIYHCDLRMRHKNGHWIWVRDTGRVYSRTPTGEPEWVIGMHVDISANKHIEEQVIAQQVTLERAQEIGRLGYWTATPTVEELFWSPKIYRILGLDDQQQQPSVEIFRSLVHPEDLEFFDQQMVSLVNGDEFDFEHRVIRPDGGIVWVHERATQSELNGRIMLVGTMQNITDRKTIETRLTELSQTDELTRIYNRRYLLERLREVISTPPTSKKAENPGVLALLDLDHFKAINDTYGHDAGDEVLKALASFLKESVRPSDVVARTGGEEFVVLMFDTTVNQALPTLNHILAGVRQLKFRFDDEPLSISTTIGVTEVAVDDIDTSDVLIRADRALYHGKNNGRDQIVTSIDTLFTDE